MTATTVTATEQGILSGQYNRPDGSLDGVPIQFPAAIIQKEGQACPVIERTAHGLCQTRTTGHANELWGEPGMHRLNQWFTAPLRRDDPGQLSIMTNKCRPSPSTKQSVVHMTGLITIIQGNDHVRPGGTTAMTGMHRTSTMHSWNPDQYVSVNCGLRRIPANAASPTGPQNLSEWVRTNPLI